MHTSVGTLYKAIVHDLVKAKWIPLPQKKQLTGESTVIQRVEDLLKRFHDAALQLKVRHDNRPTLSLKDEYDVQDLLHTLLRTIVDDVRREDPTATHAGSASRVDFLLKAEKAVIEVKMASPKVKHKQIGEQLIIDIERYGSNPDFRHLLCLVYDPEHQIENPRGLETDLNRKHGDLEVKLLIVPR